jgi:ABC-type Fe3+/spermidine/putrescine transport system ATPase subunit
MSGGRIVEVGTPEELYSRPKTLFTAQFLGGANLFDGMARPEAAAGSVIRAAIGELRLAREVSGPVTLVIRPEHITVLPDDVPMKSGDTITFGCIVQRNRFAGAGRELELRGGPDQRAVLRCRSPASLTVREGEMVQVAIDARNVTVLPRDSDVRLTEQPTG